jgi:perosamine synthetase
MPSEAPAPVSRIPLSEPDLTGREAEYLQRCIETGWVSSGGPFVTRMESLVAERVGARGAVAVSSGTAALHVALLVAGVEPDDEVLVSTLTFIAPANAVRYVGAWPVLVDADPATWQMDVERVARFLERDCVVSGGALRDRATGRRVRALLPVHVLGHPVDMDALLAVARRYDLVVIEDATESLGALYRGRPTGVLGDVGCFSFNGNKIVTAGGGGALVTRREDWLARARYLTTQAKDDEVEYEHGAVGYNYRLTNLQAAVGCAQLERLDAFVERRRQVAAAYRARLGAREGLALMREAPWARATFWLATALVDAAAFGCDSRALMRRLGAAGIQSRPLWRPLLLGGPLASAPCLGGKVAEQLHRDALSLPSSASLTDADHERVCLAVEAAADGRAPSR